MPYCIEADLDQRYHEPSVRQLVDDDVDGADDTDVIADTIEAASKHVWGAAKKHYSNLDPDTFSIATIATVPYQLRDETARLAIQYLLARRSQQDLNEIQRIEDWLDKIADRKRLLDAPTTRKAAGTHVGSERAAAPQGKLRNYAERDPNDLDADPDRNRPFQTNAN